MKILRNLAVMAALVYGQSAFSMRPEFRKDLEDVPFMTGSRFNGGPAGNALRAGFMNESWILNYCEVLLKRWHDFITKYPVDKWSKEEKKEVIECLEKMSHLYFYQEWQDQTKQVQDLLNARKEADQKVQPLLDKIRSVASSIK